MQNAQATDQNFSGLLRLFGWAIVVVCILPAAMMALGVDFGVQGEPLNLAALQHMTEDARMDALRRALPGPFLHTILEWSAFCTAIFTVLMTLAHFRVRGDITMPVIGLALFFAGSMDAFHTLAADRLISAHADNQDLIPFTWALCRLFNAGIMMLGLGMVLLRPNVTAPIALRLIAMIGLVFGALAYGIIHLCATSESLPQTQFPDFPLSRPWDLTPMVLFIVGGFFIYRPFHRMKQTLFSSALLISLIPNIAAQAYVAFGSSALFDSGFNIAHFLKLVAYVVPLGGMMLDYVAVHQRETEAIEVLRGEVSQREAIEDELRVQADELMRSNAELEQFAYVASHDLQEPLRKIQSFGDRLRDVSAGQLSQRGRDYLDRMQSAAGRMQFLIKDLLAFSRIASKAEPLQPVNLSEVVNGVLSDLEVRIEQTRARVEVGELPEIDADPRQMRQLFQNLIGNALKFNRAGVPLMVEIQGRVVPRYGGSAASLKRVGEELEISIEDNGIGFADQHTDRIFEVFQRLNPREAYEGTGIGLAIVRKIVERHGGVIRAKGRLGEGSTFVLTLPMRQKAASGSEQERDK